MEWQDRLTNGLWFGGEISGRWNEIIARQSQISCKSVRLAIGNSELQILRWC